LLRNNYYFLKIFSSLIFFFIDQLSRVEADTLGLVCRHLERVREADNKMGVDNLAMIFGLVLIWPDPNAPLNLALATGLFFQFQHKTGYLGTATIS
jgi:RhoGAP domain